MADIQQITDSVYRVQDTKGSGYVDRATANVEQTYVTYWRVDAGTNDFALERALYAWGSKHEADMDNLTDYFVHPEDYYFPTRKERQAHGSIRNVGNIVPNEYYAMRLAIGRHRRALMVHLKLAEPRAPRPRKKFIVQPYVTSDARVVHVAETERMVGEYRKSGVQWTPWTPKKEVLMTAYNVALHALTDQRTKLFSKEEVADV